MRCEKVQNFVQSRNHSNSKMVYIRVLLYLPGAAEGPGAAMISGGGNKEDVPFKVVNTTEVVFNVIVVAEVIPYK